MGLRLERNRNQEISIEIRQSFGCWDNLFWKAFACAFGLHLLAVLVFHIHAIIFVSDQLFMPIAVEIDQADLMHASDNVALAHLNDARLIRFDLIPPLSEPQLPMEDFKLEPIKFEYLSDHHQDSNLFLNLEESWLYPNLIAKTHPHAPLEILVSGPLAELAIIQNHADLVADKSLMGEVTQNVFVYDVRVAADAGNIFWFTPKGISGDSKKAREAETMLKQLRFTSQTPIHALEGEIAIVFNEQKVAA